MLVLSLPAALQDPRVGSPGLEGGGGELEAKIALISDELCGDNPGGVSSGDVLCLSLHT